MLNNLNTDLQLKIMEKYTNINLFKRNLRGYYDFPTGDYTKIKEFPDYSHFDVGSKFGNNTIFGKHSNIMDNCILGNNCKIGAYSIIGLGVELGKKTKLGKNTVQF